MKHISLLLLAAAIAAPLQTHAYSLTDAEAKKQLALEAQNLASFGNPFGKTGKFEELYDATGKPWWKVQLDKEAWSMETFGNPFGYAIPQKVLVGGVVGSALPPTVNAPAPQVRTSAVPQVLEIPQAPVVTVDAQPNTQGPANDPVPTFVGAPYAIPGGYAAKFSEPLGLSDPHGSIYQFFCSDVNVHLPTFQIDDYAPYTTSIQPDGSVKSSRPASTILGAEIDALDAGPHTCLFRFNLPTGTIESDPIQFTR